jgi:hypothetical protein
MNRVLEEMLRSFVSPSAANWDKLLPLAEFAVNNAVNRSTGSSAFFLNYGRHPGTPFSQGLPPKYRHAATAQQSVDQVRDALQRAKSAMDAAQQRQAAYYDRNKTDLQFLPGQLVLLSTKNLRSGQFQKLQPRWIGPFPVDKHIGKNAVKLVLPPSLSIHDVFHVSLLKLYKPPPTDPLTTVPTDPVLPIMRDTDQEAVIVAERTEVSYRRTRARNHRVERVFYKLHFPGHDESLDIWVPANKVSQTLKDQYTASKPNEDVAS